MLINTVYALLLERADAADRAELLLSPHVDDKHRPDMAGNRDAVEDWLSAPDPKQAKADAALMRELGVA